MSQPTINWESLTRFHDGELGRSIFVRPGMSLALYTSMPLSEVGPFVANAIEVFIAAIPAGSLRSYLANNGYHKPLTATKIKKDLRELRAVDASYKGYRLEYSEGLEGDVGLFAVRFDGVIASDGLSDTAQYLRFDLPENAEQQFGVEPLVDLCCSLAAQFPFFSGNAGFAFKRSGQAETYESREINAMLVRYLGFEGGYGRQRWHMRNHTPRPNWLSFLGSDLLFQLGGIAKLQNQLPNCQFRQVGDGWVIRAAKYPIIGDVNRQALDIGCLPDVALTLKSTRVCITEMGEDQEIFDAEKWLAAFDDRSPTPWNNE